MQQPVNLLYGYVTIDRAMSESISQTDRCHAIVKYAPEPLIAFGTDGLIITANRAGAITS